MRTTGNRTTIEKYIAKVWTLMMKTIFKIFLAREYWFKCHIWNESDTLLIAICFRENSGQKRCIFKAELNSAKSPVLQGNAWNKQIESKGSSQEVGEQRCLAVRKEVLLESALLKMILKLILLYFKHKTKPEAKK